MEQPPRARASLADTGCRHTLKYHDLRPFRFLLYSMKTYFVFVGCYGYIPLQTPKENVKKSDVCERGAGCARVKARFSVRNKARPYTKSTNRDGLGSSRIRGDGDER